MKITGKIILAGLAWAAVSLAAGAQEAAMSFIDNAISPRKAAMGGISAGLEADAYSHFGNVAAIPFSEDTFGVGLTYNGWEPSTAKTNVGVLGATYRVGRFGISLGASASIHRPYEGMDENGFTTGRFTPMDWRAGAGVSFLATSSFSVGLGLNFASSIISPYYDNLYTAFADIQFIYKLKNLTFSLSGSNLGMPVTDYFGNSYLLPMNAELAVSYANKWDRHAIEAAVAGKAHFSNGLAGAGSVGAEYEYNDMVAVRVGYNYGARNVGLPSFVSVGVGAKFFGVRVDAAYLVTASDSPMRNTFSVGLGYAF